MSGEEGTFQSEEARLRNLLKEKPKNARLLFQLSSLLTDQSKLTADAAVRSEAVQLARLAIQYVPHKPFGYAALSSASHDHEERIRALDKAIEFSSSSDHVFARAGFTVRRLVEPRAAEARQVQGIIGKASSNHPSRRCLTTEESKLYTQTLETLDEAWSAAQISDTQREFLAKNEYRLGLFFRKMNPPHTQQPRSRKHFTRCREQCTSNSELASFWLATLEVTEDCDGNGKHESNNEITKCPVDYVVGLYSTFAQKFDQLLVDKLEYKTPTMLRELLDTLNIENGPVLGKLKKKWRLGVDLGCGTGLSGLAFRDVVDSLIGVDLSEEMLEQARRRHIYKDLILGDVTCVFTGDGIIYDFVIACDVFVYIGDLSEVFHAVATSMAPSGLFCFSTEYLENSQSCSRPFKLRSCARFAHKQSYIEDLAKEFGFKIMKLEVASIRKNEGKPVKGMLVVLRPEKLSPGS